MRGDVLMEGGGLGLFRGRAHLSGGAFGDRLQYSGGVGHLNVTRGVDGENPARNTSGQGLSLVPDQSRDAHIRSPIWRGLVSPAQSRPASDRRPPSTGIVPGVRRLDVSSWKGRPGLQPGRPFSLRLCDDQRPPRRRAWLQRQLSGPEHQCAFPQRPGRTPAFNPTATPTGKMTEQPMF